MLTCDSPTLNLPFFFMKNTFWKKRKILLVHFWIFFCTIPNSKDMDHFWKENYYLAFSCQVLRVSEINSCRSRLKEQTRIWNERRVAPTLKSPVNRYWKIHKPNFRWNTIDFLILLQKYEVRSIESGFSQ